MKKQYKGLETDQVRQFKQLQEENARLKRLVAELTLDKTMLQDVLAKNCDGAKEPAHGASSGWKAEKEWSSEEAEEELT